MSGETNSLFSDKLQPGQVREEARIERSRGRSGHVWQMTTVVHYELLCYYLSFRAKPFSIVWEAPACVDVSYFFLRNVNDIAYILVWSLCVVEMLISQSKMLFVGTRYIVE